MHAAGHTTTLPLCPPGRDQVAGPDPSQQAEGSKPGQCLANLGQRVRLNKAGVGPEVYSQYFDDQADITALLNVAEGNALEFVTVFNGN